jgi:hypothetical protein
MQSLTVFQVGDVHYPDHNAPDADIKDDRLPKALIEVSTAYALQGATRALLSAIDDAPGSLLVFTGDLTSRGNLADYGSCVTFLDGAFRLSDATIWSAEQLHVVPGNHDVDRKLAKAAPSDDLFAKFAPLLDAWAAVGLDILAVKDLRQTAVSTGPAAVAAYGLNSCIGCGERRALPKQLEEHLRAAMAVNHVPDAAIDSVIAAAVNPNDEVIDAPAYSETVVDALHHAINTAPSTSVAVVVAHHNLLQQALPRFDVYTDLMNSGMLRSRLTSLGKPVLYLHGHIHSDPVEIVTQRSPDVGQLVCISAPEFADGFNRIDIIFTDAGVPLGCVVQRYRVRLSGGTSKEPAIRIPFEREEMSISPLATDAVVALMADPTCASMSDVRRRMDLDASTPDAELASALEEVEWLGLVDIMRRERAPRHWRLGVVTS